MSNAHFFTNTGSQLVDLVSRLLQPEEREVVQGDLLEGGESAWQSLLGVVGLVIRREAALWRNWRPWLAAFGLALPSSFLLMGFSLSKPCLSAAGRRPYSPRHRSYRRTRICAVPVQRLAPGRMVLDGWFCGGVDLATNGLGECRSLVRSLPILSGTVPGGISLTALPGSFFAGCALGSS
jgi:hypothetical protein